MSDNVTDISSISSDLTKHVKGPGLFYVRSRVAPSAKKILSEATFLDWYEEHAEEVVAESGIHSLFRFNAISRTSASDASKPFLTCPVLDDIGFLLSEEFRSTSPTSEILPGSKNVYDLVEFDINYLALRHKVTSRKGSSEPAKSIVTVEFQASRGLLAENMKALLDKQAHILNELPGYTRSIVLESCFSFASAASKELEDDGLQKQHILPSWVVIHTFDGVIGEDIVKRIQLDLHSTDENIGSLQAEVRGWSVQKGFGEANLFV